MRYREIASLTRYPHAVTIAVDPAHFSDFERLTRNRRDLRLLDVDHSQPDVWRLRIGCASEEAARGIRDVRGDSRVDAAG
jgi:hypothetical protein